MRKENCRKRLQLKTMIILLYFGARFRIIILLICKKTGGTKVIWCMLD